MIDRPGHLPRGPRQRGRRARLEKRAGLLARLAEAEQTLRAIRAGEVDAVVVRGPTGDQIYTLQGAEEPYRNLVEQMGQGALVLADTGDILYANARFASLLGRPLESIVGGPISRFIPEAEKPAFASLLAAGNGTCRSRLISSGAGAIDVHLSLTTTVPSTGMGSLCLIVADLRALLEARSERDAAERASHSKDEFLAMLAHELRNLLGAVRSAIGLLESADPMSAPAALARTVIARQIRHLSRLTDDLLDVQRVVSGKIRLDCQPLDMAETVRHVIASFTGDAALDRRIDLQAECVCIDGDAVRLEQVFANLITNAVKYTPPDGAIHVWVRGDADEAVVSVQDTGVGIAPGLLPTVFDMFVQGDTTLDRARGGLGIGLTLVRRLVDLHGGSVAASSGGIGNGSTFTVRLPRVPDLRAPQQVASPLMEAPQARVLLVEDSRDAREMLGLLLQQVGYEVYEAEDGYRGLALMDHEHPDVAIIDIGLPGLDGFEVARRMRAHPQGRAMVLVALTGYGTLRDREHSIEAGFDHHLVKPVDIDELRRLLDQRGAATRGGASDPLTPPTSGRSASSRP